VNTVVGVKSNLVREAVRIVHLLDETTELEGDVRSNEDKECRDKRADHVSEPFG
jgi:hypothetical protein